MKPFKVPSACVHKGPDPDFVFTTWKLGAKIVGRALNSDFLELPEAKGELTIPLFPLIGGDEWLSEAMDVDDWERVIVDGGEYAGYVGFFQVEDDRGMA